MEWYAQAGDSVENPAPWSSAGWNDAADGSGNAGSPAWGDNANGNNHWIDLADVDLTGITVSGGQFVCTKWYARENGQVALISQWNSESNGNGISQPGPTGHDTIFPGNYFVWARSDQLGTLVPGAGLLLLPSPANVLKPTEYGVVGVSHDTGELDLAAYVLKSAVVAHEWVAPGHYPYSGAGEGTYNPLAAAVFPVEAEVLEKTPPNAYGPTGVEFVGKLVVSAAVALITAVRVGVGLGV